MLLPMIFGQLDVIGRCYCHVASRFATYVLALAGVIAMLLCFLYDRWWCCCHLVDVIIGRCYCHLFLWLLVLPLLTISCTKRCTTVVVVVLLWQMLLPWWLMVLPCIWLADVVAMWLVLLPLLYFCFVGRCYCLVADGMPTMGMDGRYYSQGGWWIGHWVNVLILNLPFNNILRLTFSSDLEEAMFETGKSLSTIYKLILFLGKFN